MNVYWLEQTRADVPESDDWLGVNEVLFLNALRFANRRGDWRLGRWTAKSALSCCLGLSELYSDLARMEVRASPSGAPQAFFCDVSAPLTISLSHRNHRGLCAVAHSSVELGCDLEVIEPRSDAFVEDYFTTGEQAFIAAQPTTDRPAVVALLWSAKESALKALHEGLRLDTRSVTIDPMDLSFESDHWRPLRVNHAAETLRGWWQWADGMVRTIVAAPSPAQPIRLRVGDCHDGASPFPWSGSPPASKRGGILPVAR
jgi:4'-phosphopantetheinyl transferase